MTHLLLGIDAGGSKTAAWLAESAAADRPVVVGKGEAGAGNPLSAGWNDSLANIESAIKDAFEAAKIQPQAVTSVCLSVAGGDRESVQIRFVEWLNTNRIAEKSQVTNDAIPLLQAGCPGGVGISLIAGTGSIVYGRDSSRRTARCGGWGHLIGDQGSGYWIAMQALKAITDAEDGRGVSTTLTDSFLNYLDVNSVTELIGKVYSPESSKKEIARWARLVFSDRERGDEQAGRIVKDAATQLGQQIRTVAKRLGLDSGPFHLALAGGIITNQPEFSHQIVAACETLQVPVADAKQIDFPAWGAVLIAKQNV